MYVCTSLKKGKLYLIQFKTGDFYFVRSQFGRSIFLFRDPKAIDSILVTKFVSQCFICNVLSCINMYFFVFVPSTFGELYGNEMASHVIMDLHHIKVKQNCSKISKINPIIFSFFSFSERHSSFA